MEAEEFTQLRNLTESHGLTQVPGILLNSVRLEKPGLSIETTNFEDFTVVHGTTQQECPSLPEVAECLDIFDAG
jgi:hypothetical protein